MCSSLGVQDPVERLSQTLAARPSTLDTCSALDTFRVGSASRGRKPHYTTPLGGMDHSTVMARVYVEFGQVRQLHQPSLGRGAEKTIAHDLACGPCPAQTHSNVFKRAFEAGTRAARIPCAWTGRRSGRCTCHALGTIGRASAAPSTCHRKPPRALPEPSTSSTCATSTRAAPPPAAAAGLAPVSMNEASLSDGRPTLGVRSLHATRKSARMS